MKAVMRRSVILTATMIAISVAAPFFVPTRLLAETRGSAPLSSVIPEKFGEWTVARDQVSPVINPALDEMLGKLYSETLSRTYVNSQGYRIMLSIAYGRDQRGSLQLHYPEVCYPAQGFMVKTNVQGSLRLDDGSGIPVRRLETELGRTRPEPVTYWTLIGNEPALGGFEKKYIEARYALGGWVPDGILFRVSSIDSNSPKAFEMQEEFSRQLINSLGKADVVRIRGLPSSPV